VVDEVPRAGPCQQWLHSYDGCLHSTAKQTMMPMTL